MTGSDEKRKSRWIHWVVTGLVFVLRDEAYAIGVGWAGLAGQKSVIRVVVRVIGDGARIIRHRQLVAVVVVRVRLGPHLLCLIVPDALRPDVQRVVVFPLL